MAEETAQKAGDRRVDAIDIVVQSSALTFTNPAESISGLGTDSRVLMVRYQGRDVPPQVEVLFTGPQFNVDDFHKKAARSGRKIVHDIPAA